MNPQKNFKNILCSLTLGLSIFAFSIQNANAYPEKERNITNQRKGINFKKKTKRK